MRESERESERESVRVRVRERERERERERIMLTKSVLVTRHKGEKCPLKWERCE